MAEKDKVSAEEAAKANTASVDKSVDEWRASQGLPAIDRSKEARALKEPADDEG